LAIRRKEVGKRERYHWEYICFCPFKKIIDKICKAKFASIAFYKEFNTEKNPEVI
jgi:hypothetical protein